MQTPSCAAPQLPLDGSGHSTSASSARASPRRWGSSACPAEPHALATPAAQRPQPRQRSAGRRPATPPLLNGRTRQQPCKAARACSWAGEPLALAQRYRRAGQGRAERRVARARRSGEPRARAGVCGEQSRAQRAGAGDPAGSRTPPVLERGRPAPWSGPRQAEGAVPTHRGAACAARATPPFSGATPGRLGSPANEGQRDGPERGSAELPGRGTAPPQTRPPPPSQQRCQRVEPGPQPSRGRRRRVRGAERSPAARILLGPDARTGLLPPSKGPASRPSAARACTRAGEPQHVVGSAGAGGSGRPAVGSGRSLTGQPTPLRPADPCPAPGAGGLVPAPTHRPGSRETPRGRPPAGCRRQRRPGPPGAAPRRSSPLPWRPPHCPAARAGGAPRWPGRSDPAWRRQPTQGVLARGLAWPGPAAGAASSVAGRSRAVRTPRPPAPRPGPCPQEPGGGGGRAAGSGRRCPRSRLRLTSRPPGPLPTLGSAPEAPLPACKMAAGTSAAGHVRGLPGLTPPRGGRRHLGRGQRGRPPGVGLRARLVLPRCGGASRGDAGAGSQTPRASPSAGVADRRLRPRRGWVSHGDRTARADRARPV